MPQPTIHTAQAETVKEQIAAVNAQMKKAKEAEPFFDPIREFARGSKIEGTVSHWLTLDVEERRRYLELNFNPVERMRGETVKQMEARDLERKRALWVIIQEETRRAPKQENFEMALIALKKLCPNVQWSPPKPQEPPAPQEPVEG